MSVIASRITHRIAGAIALVGLIIKSSTTANAADCPTITSGSGVPSATEPNGSRYLRFNGQEYRRIGGAWEAVDSATAGLVQVADNGVLSYGADQDIVHTHSGDSVRVTNAAAGTMGYDDDVLVVCDPAAPTKRARLDAGEVSADQTRVITVPDQNIGSDQFILKATGTISAAALRTLNATPVSMIAAPGAGKYIKVLWVHWFLDYGGVQMDAAAAGDTLEAKYTNGSGAAVVDAVAGNTIGGVTADYHTTVLAVPEVVPVTNAAIVAHVNTGEWYAAAGTSELKFIVYYQVVTLPT